MCAEKPRRLKGNEYKTRKVGTCRKVERQLWSYRNKPHNRVIFRDIFSLYMKVSSILVITVILNLQNRVVFKHIFSILVYVIIRLHIMVILRDIFSVSTISTNYNVSIRSSLLFFLLWFKKYINIFRFRILLSIPGCTWI